MVIYTPRFRCQPGGFIVFLVFFFLLICASCNNRVVATAFRAEGHPITEKQERARDSNARSMRDKFDGDPLPYGIDESRPTLEQFMRCTNERASHIATPRLMLASISLWR